MFVVASQFVRAADRSSVTRSSDLDARCARISKTEKHPSSVQFDILISQTLIKQDILKPTYLSEAKNQSHPVQQEAQKTLAALGHADPPKARGIRILSIDGGGMRMRNMHEKRNPFFSPEWCCLGCENDVVMIYNEKTTFFLGKNANEKGPFECGGADFSGSGVTKSPLIGFPPPSKTSGCTTINLFKYCSFNAKNSIRHTMKTNPTKRTTSFIFGRVEESEPSSGAYYTEQRRYVTRQQ
ncbi:unnamed protein product [Nesidiocoris tenuis]|uniref:Uncharacterized protein n=1 Tax=Nesidiocoris tenuis TaxID=355587 RepID=A0A6H5G253_9HEMI|nr:unnamed protein product [Nesidiocoris tenuis]